jgi:hypothetical protein
MVIVLGYFFFGTEITWQAAEIIFFFRRSVL